MKNVVLRISRNVLLRKIHLQNNVSGEMLTVNSLFKRLFIKLLSFVFNLLDYTVVPRNSVNTPA